MTTRKKYKDFIPKGDYEKLLWNQNFLNHLDKACTATIPYFTEAEKTELRTEITAYNEALLAVHRLKNELSAAVKHKDDLEKNTVKNIRRIASMMKSSFTASEAVNALMGIKCSSATIDLSEVRPTIKAKVYGSEVQLHFHKHHTLNISFYCRLPDGEWQHIGNEITSPFIDKRQPVIIGQPEKREYKARYHDLKETIGLESSIVSVVFGGGAP
ncbi:hypothetical protein SAMN05421788_10927 [Filimonas lacunae]|uniref:Uncharacterized protein n=1 Tax=Filimonas lacunae TaxID=477680 RepID=A0A173MJ06_9BACT|nr:hypothetical protein [Filimonas lacunae]BAV07622.1 hypothetical protein FLA_3648 [Filimonas lacunae]SIT29759.1 hypothetical protein SAMN05421788_10927 [Filimonas lacunae]